MIAPALASLVAMCEYSLDRVLIHETGRNSIELRKANDEHEKPYRKGNEQHAAAAEPRSKAALPSWCERLGGKLGEDPDREGLSGRRCAPRKPCGF